MPIALNTAKSRSRSRAERYTTEPTISTATIHSKTATIEIEFTATFNGRTKSLTAPTRSKVW
ncbi:Uncharacterised protein [Mycobacterium tuberculosis]|nr:Uncharacterised protein [Mycobacterium tuberculosis]COX06673.1 Uncharacterised protein [Mycobacterium tuberculosis]